MRKLYADGGVVAKNPSPIGGTWAWCLVQGDVLLSRDGGFISIFDMGYDVVTNNQTELLAVIKGLEFLPDDLDQLEICSDSNITLGRIFKNFTFNNIPGWMERDLREHKKRLINFHKFTYTLIDGHPTVAQLESGFGKRGHPTSRWNVLADNMCNRIASKYKVLA